MNDSYRLVTLQAVVRGKGRGAKVTVACRSDDGLKMLKREVRNMAADDFGTSRRRVKVVVLGDRP